MLTIIGIKGRLNLACMTEGRGIGLDTIGVDLPSRSG